MALAAQMMVVSAAFMFLTIGAKDVPSAEVSLYMLLELILCTGTEHACLKYILLVFLNSSCF